MIKEAYLRYYDNNRVDLVIESDDYEFEDGGVALVDLRPDDLDKLDKPISEAFRIKFRLTKT